MMLTVIAVLIAIVVIIVFYLRTTNDNILPCFQINPPVLPAPPQDDLKIFEQHYMATLVPKFMQKAEKIVNPTRLFSNDGNIFVGLQPFQAASDFGTALHTLIGYGVRFSTVGDTLYHDATLATNLKSALMLIHDRLPFPAPINAAPWGERVDWYHFSITMPEFFQNTCIVLRGFYNLTAPVEEVLRYYLPEPTMSMGWRRTAGNAMRMGLPYAYGQLLRGYSCRQIAQEREMAYVLDLIRFPLVHQGNGIHYDYAYFDHTDVRAYGYLINSYFTFSYYNFLFGDDVANMYNLEKCISLVGSPRGYANPAVLARQGSNYSNVIGTFIDYKNEVVSGDYSKILSIRTNTYFGSVVGQSPEIAYYEADQNNNLHAPLWAMTRKIWANDGAIIQYRSGMLGIESGVLLTTNLNGIVSVPTTGPTTSSFHPKIAYTGICATTNAGVMAQHCSFAELNIEFFSYTLYHRLGMTQVYDKIRALQMLSSNARCVILARDLNVNLPNDPAWTAPSNIISYNRVTAKHHNIVNSPNMSNFVIRTIDVANMQTVEQIISFESINNGTGTSCFSLLVQSQHQYDDTSIIRLTPDTFLIETNDSSIKCVINFPYIILVDYETNEVTINDATNRSRYNHRLNIDDLIQPLSYVSLTVGNLQSNVIKRQDNYFYYDNPNANQFKFKI
uniref:Odv-e66 n=1 Tax=Helicoverpa armigera nucleopolyhedrovirus TaxID=51313 RepID=A0A482EUC3_9ABAC|nr:odv-e66 [Helicoverpa armigera nucleopolyhedrovirus]